MIMQLRRIFRFCQAKAYIDRFSTLQSQVNRLEIQVIQKKQHLERMNKAIDMTLEDKFKKLFGDLMNFPYQSRGMMNERLRKERLLSEINQLEKDLEGKLEKIQKQKKEEQLNKQTIFLTHLARFNVKYEKVIGSKPFLQQVQAGLELSTKSLSKTLNKEGVQFLGKSDQEYNSTLHERVQGEGNLLKQVLQKGIKIKDIVIQKAKVSLKK